MTSIPFLRWRLFAQQPLQRPLSPGKQAAQAAFAGQGGELFQALALLQTGKKLCPVGMGPDGSSGVRIRRQQRVQAALPADQSGRDPVKQLLALFRIDQDHGCAPVIIQLRHVLFNAPGVADGQIGQPGNSLEPAAMTGWPQADVPQVQNLQAVSHSCTPNS